MSEVGSSRLEEEEERKKESNLTYLLTNSPIPVSYKSNPEVQRNWRRFCALSEQHIGVMYDRAIQEYMLNHRDSLPLQPTFNLIEQPELEDLKNRCEFAECKRKIAGKVLRIRDGKEYRVCEEHLQLCKGENKGFNPKFWEWRIVQ